MTCTHEIGIYFNQLKPIETNFSKAIFSILNFFTSRVDLYQLQSLSKPTYLPTLLINMPLLAFSPSLRSPHEAVLLEIQYLHQIRMTKWM